MTWAIDVGNTQTVVGVWDGAWRAVWRLATDSAQTEDQLAASLAALCDLAGLPFHAERVLAASVVPPVDDAWTRMSERYLQCPVRFLRNGDQVGLVVEYDPPHAVGADRLANAIAALALVPPPIIVVDFGTATTFDVIDARRAYIGGVILPGVLVSLESLVARTAKLPRIALEPPATAIGRSTVASLQSGAVLGYAGAIDALIGHIEGELGAKPNVLATGGLGAAYAQVCTRIERYEPYLTLDGLRMAGALLETPRP